MKTTDLLNCITSHVNDLASALIQYRKHRNIREAELKQLWKLLKAAGGSGLVNKTTIVECDVVDGAFLWSFATAAECSKITWAANARTRNEIAERVMLSLQSPIIGADQLRHAIYELQDVLHAIWQ